MKIQIDQKIQQKPQQTNKLFVKEVDSKYISCQRYLHLQQQTQIQSIQKNNNKTPVFIFTITNTNMKIQIDQKIQQKPQQTNKLFVKEVDSKYIS